MSKATAQTLIVLGCIAGTVALLLQGVDGWGWLVFIAILAVLG